MAVQARMVERETKMQENNVNQEKVTEEMNRLKKSRREDLAGWIRSLWPQALGKTPGVHVAAAWGCGKAKEIRREEGNFARAWGTLSEPAGE